jgi:hypothetical protein
MKFCNITISVPMDNTQIVRMLNTRIYRQLPTYRNITFKTIVRRLINYIDRRRIRRYMVLLVNASLHLRDNYEDAEVEADVVPEVYIVPEGGDYIDPVPERMYHIYHEFSKKEQRCIKLFGGIIKKATEDDHFVILNLLRILNLEAEPDEALLAAFNRNADAINNINNI